MRSTYEGVSAAARLAYEGHFGNQSAEVFEESMNAIDAIVALAVGELESARLRDLPPPP